jgi:putative SOS response-associated peptidase YedK
MCGRFALAYVRAFHTRFEVIDHAARVEPRFNIAPTQTVPVVVRESTNKVVEMRWGLVPFWAKDPKIGNKMINARAESVATKPAFRTSLKRRRCLVPATGFYEWRLSGKTKQPYYIQTKDGQMFAFAGIYDNWRGPDGGALQSFAIVTTKANAFMSKIHDRMPVILRREHEALWLSDGQLSEDDLGEVLKPYPSGEMRAHTVSTDVNNPRNDSEDLIRQLARA